jgi:hypothetical protein
VKRSLALVVVAAIVFGSAHPALAYLKFGVTVRGAEVPLKWAQTPVRYFVTDRGTTGVSATDLQAAAGRAFAGWQAVPTASIGYQFGGFTAAPPDRDDGLSTLGFRDRPEFDRVLASTSFVVDAATGALVESDITFISTFQWSVAPAGEANRYDLESIALHEIGHFSGLGHSALGETELREGGGRRVLGAEAVMFPIAFAIGSIAGRTLKADDIAGISDLYPDGDFTRALGSISGRVLKDGHPIFGAHVVAFDVARGSMVGTFSLDAQGHFAAGGLSPGVHILRVEPIDDADVESFFDAVNTVDVDFRVAFVDRVVIVPRGGDSGEVTVKVVGK